MHIEAHTMLVEARRYRDLDSQETVAAWSNVLDSEGKTDDPV